MKKVTSILVVAVALLVVMAGMALAGIATTKHNLSSTSGNAIKGDIQEICVYCHTPHGGDAAVAPLWNRTNNSGASFTPYSSTTVTQASGPGGISLACLSCHDGVTAVNTMLNYQGSSRTGSTKITSGSALLDTNLSNDHPLGVSVDVATSHDDYLQVPDFATTGIRVFAGNTVECASCHNVHDNSKGMFLAAYNTNSAICVACHLK